MNLALFSLELNISFKIWVGQLLYLTFVSASCNVLHDKQINCLRVVPAPSKVGVNEVVNYAHGCPKLRFLKKVSRNYSHDLERSTKTSIG